MADEKQHPYFLSKTQSDVLIAEINKVERYFSATVNDATPTTMVRLVEVIATILMRTEGFEE